MRLGSVRSSSDRGGRTRVALADLLLLLATGLQLEDDVHVGSEVLRVVHGISWLLDPLALQGDASQRGNCPHADCSSGCSTGVDLTDASVEEAQDHRSFVELLVVDLSWLLSVVETENGSVCQRVPCGDCQCAVPCVVGCN